MSNIALKIFGISLFALCLFSCDDDTPEESDVAVFVTPSSTEDVTLQSGDKYIYECGLYTKHNYVSRLRVKSTDNFSGETTLLDTAFTERTSSYSFVYNAPIIDRDSLSVTLTFNAWDDNGNKCEVKRKLTIKNRQVLIAEKSGIVLYSPQTGRPNALKFSLPSQTFDWKNSPDSVNADLFIETETFDVVNFRSNTAAKFVRNNSFDYPAATALSIQAVYSGSVRTDKIEDIRTNDIILVGHNSTAEGVFRVANVIRTGADAERCLQLAFKGVVSE